MELGDPTADHRIERGRLDVALDRLNDDLPNSWKRLKPVRLNTSTPQRRWRCGIASKPSATGCPWLTTLWLPTRKPRPGRNLLLLHPDQVFGAGAAALTWGPRRSSRGTPQVDVGRDVAAGVARLAALQRDGVVSTEKVQIVAQAMQKLSRAGLNPDARHEPFGYRRRYDECTRKMIAQEPDPIEAPVIRELFERVKSGHSLRSIARDFERRGINTRSGKVFSPQHLRVLATTAAYAGLRVHDSKGRGAGRGHSPQPGTPGVTVVKATWEPLVSEATYRAVQRLLNDPKRVTTRPGRAKHLLAGIAVCDKCNGPIFATFRHEVPSYQCRKGCIRVQKADIEELAEGVILAYLARPDVHQALSRAEADSDALHAVRNELAAARARLAELADAAATGTITIATVARAEPQILATIGALERREAELATPSAFHGFINPGADVARRCEAAPMSTRREIARLLLTPDMIGELRVTPRPAGWPGAGISQLLLA